MKPDKKQPAIFYIQKQEAMVFGAFLQEPRTVHFPKEIINHGEILNQHAFTHLIKEFLTTLQLPDVTMIILLDTDITFEKDITTQNITERNKEVEQFLDIAIFEQVTSRLYLLKQGSYVVAANEQLCDLVLGVLSELNVHVLGIVPVAIILRIMADVTMPLDMQKILQRIDILKRYSFNANGDMFEVRKDVKEESRPEVSIRLLGLSGTFVLFLVMFIIVLYTNFFPINQPKITSTGKKIVPIHTSVPSILKTSPTIIPSSGITRLPTSIPGLTITASSSGQK